MTNNLFAGPAIALLKVSDRRRKDVPPMTKILLIAATVFSLGAAALGFLNRGKLVDTRTELENASAQISGARQEAEAAKKQVEEQKEQISGLGSEKDTLTAQLGEAKSELDKAKEALVAAEEKATNAETQLTQATTDAEAKDTRIAELEQQLVEGSPAAATAETADATALVAERDELRTVVAGLEDRASGLEAQIAELRRKDQARQKTQMRQGLQGTVLAVNQAWNFVVLSLGDRQGVVPNAEMLVQRGGQLLGKVRVTSVEPSTSIADILVRTVPRGLSVMPGDTVIYQAQRN
jgi:cell division protein FtsL